MLHVDGLIDDVMYDIYERYFSEYEGNLTLNGMIYVEADPDVCYQRVAKRSRDGESNIALDYLQKCHEYHCKWIKHTETKILTLNVNDNVEVSVLQGKMQNWLYEAESFLRQFVEKPQSVNASA